MTLTSPVAPVTLLDVVRAYDATYDDQEHAAICEAIRVPAAWAAYTEYRATQALYHRGASCWTDYIALDRRWIAAQSAMRSITL